MKTHTQNSLRSPASRARRRSGWRGQAAFTITELMIASGLFSLVVIGSVTSHLVGLRMCTITKTKLQTTHNARAALNRTRDEIRSAAVLTVGNVYGATFTNVTANGQRQGNGLKLCPTSNTNNYVVYYVDMSEQTLKRKTSAGITETIASFITNTIPFAAEDYAGNVLTNDQNHRVIRMNLEFYQWEFASPNRGGSNSYEYYSIQTRTARRAL